MQNEIKEIASKSYNAVASQLAELPSLLSNASAVAVSASPSPGRVDAHVNAEAVNCSSSVGSAVNAKTTRRTWAQAVAGLSPSASPNSNVPLPLDVSTDAQPLPTPTGNYLPLPTIRMRSAGVSPNASAKTTRQTKAKIAIMLLLGKTVITLGLMLLHLKNGSTCHRLNQQSQVIRLLPLYISKLILTNKKCFAFLS